LTALCGGSDEAIEALADEVIIRMLFAAVHEAGFGTDEASQTCSPMSVD
jgi:hypothetical protein